MMIHEYLLTHLPPLIAAFSRLERVPMPSRGFVFVSSYRQGR